MGRRVLGVRACMEGVHSLEVPKSIKAFPPALDKLILFTLQLIRFGVNFGEIFGTASELVDS